ncbi:hypothetical protein GJ744_005367 [Endocarpon pusillum]|uniref:AAA+ ATPase domain-containing protein n=1 Tax=Endocarpon pusillum TaxID=364733 RepID=A0A8H7E8X2_9EURO|nr:hypothetical protein GJ744_005367 [Endocarpon pusillum]
MRLLHFGDTGRLTLEDFSGRIIPPYAILSHRWGDDEVIFEDLKDDRYKNKTGYRKIEFCVEQAAQDRLQHFWIDTCCIDKWNRHELSKAINSMFRWYRNATKCYVFLSDVSVSTAIDARLQSTWEASFRASKWFTRGWTLQELIAPESVQFFSSEGHLLGDKRFLEQLVHEITSIPVTALQGCSLGNFSIADRMAWAETRETKEPEDSVYCLLGLLDVVMPISYDEGKEKALERLQNELEAARTTPSILPFSRNSHYIGRELQLAELEAKLFRDRQTTMIAITGVGGTGKSQLALELAYRTKSENKNCLVFWIDASDIDSLHQAYSNIAQKLGVSGWDDETADIKLLVKHYLSRESARQWLLIFDNADDVNLGSTGLSTPHSANLVDYLPQSELGSIVFTTTNSDTARTLAVQTTIELQMMTPDSAQRMLENYLNTSVPTSEKQEMQLLVKELSYLPLAIVQAAAYINHENITLKDYRSQLVNQKEGALELSSELPEGKLQDCDTRIPVNTTLLISLEQIGHNHPLAARYLFLAACVDRKDIPLDLLRAASPRDSESERESAVGILNAYALITRRPAESSLDIHRLVHFAIRKGLEKRELLGQCTQKAIRRLLKLFPDHKHGSRSKWRRLLPHAIYALSYGLNEKEDEDRTKLTWKCAMTLYSDGRYNESEELIGRVMETHKTKRGADDLDTLISMDSLASNYRNQGRWEEAEELQTQVVETIKRVQGLEDPSTLTSMANLALIYRNQGRWKKAEELFIQVLEAEKRVLGLEHPSTLTSMANLALTYDSQGRWKEAEELQVQVIDTRKRLLGLEHPDTLSSINNLALVYRDQGRWKEAEELQMQVMNTCNLALTYRSQGRWKEAEELQVQKMETTKRVLGLEHPSTLGSMHNLALAYGNQGRWKEAEGLVVQVVETCKRVLRPDHPLTLDSMANLASIYHGQGRWKEAEELEVKVMETRVVGPDHPSTLTSMNNLASIYRHQGRHKEAEELQVQVMDTRKRVLGPEHHQTLTSMNNLALTYKGQRRWKEAEELEVQGIETSKKVLGPDHPHTLSSIGNLAWTYGNQGRQKEAEELLVQVLDTRKRVLGPEHPSTLSSMAKLAWTVKRRGRDREALELMAACHDARIKTLGPMDPVTQAASKALVKWRGATTDSSAC